MVKDLKLIKIRRALSLVFARVFGYRAENPRDLRTTRRILKLKPIYDSTASDGLCRENYASHGVMFRHKGNFSVPTGSLRVQSLSSPVKAGCFKQHPERFTWAKATWFLEA